jgi:hypothetical protein
MESALRDAFWLTTAVVMRRAFRRLCISTIYSVQDAMDTMDPALRRDCETQSTTNSIGRHDVLPRHDSDLCDYMSACI